MNARQQSWADANFAAYQERLKQQMTAAHGTNR